MMFLTDVKWNQILLSNTIQDNKLIPEFKPVVFDGLFYCFCVIVATNVF